jgi:hypothetical protein
MMMLDRKQFDDFDDDFSDLDEKLDHASDIDSSGLSASNPLSWRKTIIERAANNVRKAVEQKSDINANYKIGTLVFDDESNKFGRVAEWRPGFLNISLLTGGRLVKQDLNKLDFIKENRQKMTLPEMARELSLSDVEVISMLNKIELELEAPVKVSVKVKKETKAKPQNNKAKASVKKPELKVLSKEKAKPKPTKTVIGQAIKIAAKAPASKAVKKLPKLAKGKSIGVSRLLPKGISTDPVVDPNGYIRQNYLQMSNKELARATSLSEHTVRRKLGEWGLKRKERQ